MFRRHYSVYQTIRLASSILCFFPGIQTIARIRTLLIDTWWKNRALEGSGYQWVEIDRIFLFSR